MIDPNVMLILVGIGKGLLYGALTAGLGYIKNETWETFIPEKFLKTVIIGAVIGGIAGTGTGLTEAAEIIGAEIGIPGSVVEGFIMSGLTIVVDQLVMLIARHTPLGEVWQKIKDFFNTKILKR